MKRFRTILFFLGMCLVFSAVLGYRVYYSLSINGAAAFAADEGKQKKDEIGKEGKAEQEKPCPECPECPDPAKVVLRGLEDKKTMVEKQQKELAQEKKELERFEEQIDEKLVNLNALKKQIKEDLVLLKKEKTRKEQEKEAAYEAKIGKLVKMYAGMKPKNAAQIVDEMKLEVAQEIFLRMREASASQILSFVSSEKAAKISERLAFKRK